MLLVCKQCGHEQEKINLGRRVTYKYSNGLSLYKTPEMRDWKEVPTDKCEKCKNEDMNFPIEHFSNISGKESGRRDPKSSLYWKNGKTADQISHVIAGEAEPY
jgi:hypothetical protein